MATEIIEDPITKITRIIDRPDGAQAKIVAEVMTSLVPESLSSLTH